MNITERFIDFAKLPAEKKHVFFQQLWDFDQQIFPNGTIEALYQYVHNRDAAAVHVVQYFYEDKLIGQNIIPILKLQLEQQPIFVVTSRAGFLPEYRRRNRSLRSAIRVSLKHRMHYPNAPLWFVTTLMQPKIYSLFASRTKNFYPRRDRGMAKDHLNVLKMVLENKSGVEKRGTDVFTHLCDMPKVTSEQLIRLRNRHDLHHQFFMQHVPDYFSGMGLVCVCQLNLKTIVETTFNLAIGRNVN
ncbi:hypothetical protein [Acinetobacter tianfuensis]|uniref:GNAT family N-acetyltransferase n=1 Tax=Acinetobacter tianfuensis TaxID=2419603 RepID=A0A3A8EBS4_9GAMM|nr:hypothetical protein [Acinetobacter tianfuensis]RKG30956.1 hypothetical protein D7V32_09875 [Acinetobacter tianfuensis]